MSVREGVRVCVRVCVGVCVCECMRIGIRPTDIEEPFSLVISILQMQLKLCVNEYIFSCSPKCILNSSSNSLCC